jgi:hypothetical protein
MKLLSLLEMVLKESFLLLSMNIMRNNWLLVFVLYSKNRSIIFVAFKSSRCAMKMRCFFFYGKWEKGGIFEFSFLKSFSIWSVYLIFMFIIWLAEIPAAKRTPFTFSIYNSALLVTHRASPLVFTRRLSKYHHTLLSRPA